MPWFADEELHLADVVVSLPGAGAFAPLDDGVVIEDADGALLLVEADGDVSDYDGAMPDVPEPDAAVAVRRERAERPAPRRRRGARAGTPVHLMELRSSRHEAEVYLRQSETVRRLFLVCLDARLHLDRSASWCRARDVRLR